MRTYRKELIKYLTTHPSYTKIDDARIDLLVAQTRYESNFDKTLRELITCGEIEICGNEIKNKEGE